MKDDVSAPYINAMMIVWYAENDVIALKCYYYLELNVVAYYRDNDYSP